jgi:hypothetical protein
MQVSQIIRSGHTQGHERYTCGNLLIIFKTTGCPRMSVRILNIIIEKTNRTTTVRVSPHDSRTVEVLRTIFVVTSVHDCA